jgi:hypothetical protein
MEEVVWVARRKFVSRAGLLTGALSAGGLGVAPSASWAVDLAVLTTLQGESLMAMLKTIAPHDRLEDAAYAMVIKSIDTELQTDAGKKALVATGLDGLNTTSPFAALSPEQRVAALRTIEPTPFFQTIRVDTLQRLYSTPFAYALFGYEGESFSKGGYRSRGFNDLRWLPDPPLSAGGALS